MRLLLAEDDRMLDERLVRGLSRSGYAVDWIRDGLGARDALGLVRYDLVVLDLGLPSVDGIRVLREFCSEGQTTPLLILTARDASADRVRGLDAGADIYLVKPFNLDELLVRLRALLRRFAGHPAPVFQHLGVQLDQATREVCVAGVAVALTRREFSLLEALLEHPSRFWTRERLIDPIYEFRLERAGSPYPCATTQNCRGLHHQCPWCRPHTPVQMKSLRQQNLWPVLASVPASGIVGTATTYWLIDDELEELCDSPLRGIAAAVGGESTAAIRLEEYNPALDDGFTIQVWERRRLTFRSGPLVDLEPGHALPVGEDTALSTLIDVLVDNAIGYEPPPGRIEVSLKDGIQNIDLEIADTGPGIPAAERSRVLDRFYRGSISNLVSGDNGNGLGLSIAAAIARQHRAELSLHGGHKGRRLRVRLRLPTSRDPVPVPDFLP